MFSWNEIKKTFKEKVSEKSDLLDKAIGLAEVAGKSIVASATVAYNVITKNTTLKVAEKYVETKKHLENEVENHPTEFWRKNTQSRVVFLGHAITKTEQKIRSTDKRSEEGRSNLRSLEHQLDGLREELSVKKRLLSDNEDKRYVAKCQEKLSAQLAKKEQMIESINKDIIQKTNKISELEATLQKNNISNQSESEKEEAEKNKSEIFELKSIIRKERNLLNEIESF
ncbi:MAG: hypothetical protein ACRDBF_14365 [Plesiomonas shigelloides]